MPLAFSRSLLVCAGLLLLLAGCGGSASSPPPQPSSATASPPPAPSPSGTGEEPAHVGEQSLLAPASTVVAASPTPLPTTTPEPLPSPPPTPRLFQLTSGGCCTQPFWSADSRAVRFIDKPGAGAPVGIWEVPVDLPGTSPTLFSERIGYYSRDGAFFVEITGGTTVVERLADGQRWELPTRQENPAISPDQQRVAWSVRDRSLPWDRQVSQIWVAAIDGSGAEPIMSLARGGVQGWISDELLLLSGRDSLEDETQQLFTLSLRDGTRTELARSERLRGTLLAPGGEWVAYLIAQSEDPAENGIWLVRVDGSERHRLPAELFGAYQWRDATRLLLVPFRPDAPSHELWELDVTTMQFRQLTDPAQLPFKIANGDWSVSPDGRRVAFVESRDRNIWVIEIAP